MARQMLRKGQKETIMPTRNFLTAREINNIEDKPLKRPIPTEVEKWTVAEKSNWIHTEVKDFLSEIFLRPNDLAEMVDQLDAAHKEGFQCRSQGCLAVFPLHSSRVRHEISQHPELDVESDGDADRDSLGYYKCRGGACRQVFTTSATRKRYIYMTWFNVIPCLTFTFLL